MRSARDGGKEKVEAAAGRSYRVGVETEGLYVETW